MKSLIEHFLRKRKTSMQRSCLFIMSDLTWIPKRLTVSTPKPSSLSLITLQPLRDKSTNSRQAVWTPVVRAAWKRISEVAVQKLRKLCLIWATSTHLYRSIRAMSLTARQIRQWTSRRTLRRTTKLLHMSLFKITSCFSKTYRKRYTGHIRSSRAEPYRQHLSLKTMRQQ